MWNYIVKLFKVIVLFFIHSKEETIEEVQAEPAIEVDDVSLTYKYKSKYSGSRSFTKAPRIENNIF